MACEPELPPLYVQGSKAGPGPIQGPASDVIRVSGVKTRV